MNPTPEEDTMRQRSHPSAIVLATLLACLLFATDRASADGVTVIVPVNVTHLHEEVSEVIVIISFISDQGIQVAYGNGTRTPVDHSVQEDVEVFVIPTNANTNIMDATTYTISLFLRHADNPRSCEANKVYTDTNLLHCNAHFSKIQTYEAQEGPISDLVPQ